MSVTSSLSLRLSCLPALSPCLHSFFSFLTTLCALPPSCLCISVLSQRPSRLFPSISFCPSLNICLFSTSAVHPALCLPNRLLFSCLSPHLCPPISCIPESFTKPWQPGSSASIFSLWSLSPLPLHLPIRSLPTPLHLSRVCALTTLLSHPFSVSVSPHVSRFLSSVSSPFPTRSISFLSSMTLSSESLSRPISLDGVEGRRVGEVGLLLLGAH